MWIQAPARLPSRELHCVLCQPVAVAHVIPVCVMHHYDSADVGVHMRLGPRGCYTHVHVCAPAHWPRGGPKREAASHFRTLLGLAPSSPKQCS